MITLSNFIKNADDFTLLLTMGEKDTVDMLPTVDRPFSPDFYAVSVDYGVPAAGSVAINYFTQENFVFVNGEWSKDSVPSILDQLEVDENGVYVPAVGVDGYDRVTVDVPQLDTSDATAVASDILSPKTAYVNGQKITGTIGLEEGSATPTKAEQTIAPTAGKYFDSFVVNPIPSQYIVPSGTKTITANGTADVTAVASVSVNVTTTDVYKHDVHIKLKQANPGDLSTTNFRNYSTCEIRYVKCNTYASAYTTDDTRPFFDFLPGVYDLASVKLVNTDTGNTLYFSQFKLDDYQGGEFSLSNWGGADESLIKDRMESFTVTDTVTKIS